MITCYRSRTVRAIPTPFICQLGSILYAFMFLFPLAATAQLDFRPGYVVMTNGDTLRGLVSYRGGKKNSEAVAFRQSKKARPTVYDANQVMAYGIYNARAFESLELPPGVPDTGRVFARVLAKGYFDLYRYRDLFLLDANDSLILLPKPRNEPVGGPDSKVIKRSKRYIGVLNYVMLDCQMNANEAAYSDRDLQRVITRYNVCKSGGPVAEPSDSRLDLDLILFGGYSNNLMTYHYYRIIPFPGNTMVAGAGIELSYPRTFDRLIVSVEAIYVKNYYQGYYEVGFPTETVRQDVFFHCTSVQLPLGIRYNLRRPDNTPYVKAGLSWQPLVSTSVRTIQENESLQGVVTTTEFEGDYDFKSPKGFWAAVGYTRKVAGGIDVFLEFRYGMTQGYLGSPIVDDSKNRSLNFFAGIRF